MSLGGGGGEIPKGGRAGRARSLGIWPGGEIPRDLVPGGKITGGQNPWDTGLKKRVREGWLRGESGISKTRELFLSSHSHLFQKKNKPIRDYARKYIL